MTAPARSSAATSASLPRRAPQPGIDSSLSSVPPVCPRPRPESCGTAAPQLATSGARISDTLSPTPPVECLSTVGLRSRVRSRRSPEAIISPVHALSSAPLRPVKQIAISSAAICSSATSWAAYAANSQPISWSVSGLTLSRLSWINDTASGLGSPVAVSAGSLGAPPLPRLPAGGQVGVVEGGGQQLAERHRAAGRVHEERRAARLEQELAAAAARQQGVAVARDDRDRHERRPGGPRRPWRCRGVQGRDESALGAQREAERRVFHVAARHDPPVRGQPGGADQQP